jgi:hypothetical protein
MSNLSRRSLVASAATLPALALPAVALPASSEPDPIFAAIEAHRALFIKMMRAARVRSHIEHGEPRSLKMRPARPKQMLNRIYLTPLRPPLPAYWR